MTSKLRREPFLVSLLMNQPKDGRFSNMLKTKILSNQLNKLNTPVRFNLNADGEPITNAKSYNAKTSPRKHTNRPPGDHEEETENEENINNEEIFLDERTKSKCDQWLEKHVIPYLSQVNYSNSNSTFTSSDQQQQQLDDTTTNSND